MEVNYTFSVLSLQRLLEILEKRHENHLRDDQCRVRLGTTHLYSVCHVFWSGQFQAGGVAAGLGPGPGLLPDLRHPGRAHTRGQVHSQAQAGGAWQAGRHLLQIKYHIFFTT